MSNLADFEIDNTEIDVSFGGTIYEAAYDDGNNIVYPVSSPSQNNKLYVEKNINDIALAIGKHLKVSEMADAITVIVERDGLFPYGGNSGIQMNIQLIEIL